MKSILRHGTTIPTVNDLDENQMGYCSGDNNLYIKSNGQIHKITGKQDKIAYGEKWIFENLVQYFPSLNCITDSNGERIVFEKTQIISNANGVKALVLPLTYLDSFNGDTAHGDCELIIENGSNTICISGYDNIVLGNTDASYTVSKDFVSSAHTKMTYFIDDIVLEVNTFVLDATDNKVLVTIEKTSNGEANKLSSETIVY